MAKLNWDKIRKETQQSLRYAQDNGKYRRDLIIADPKWQLGKHRNKPMKQIPLEYLKWVVESFDSQSAHRTKAQMEIAFRKSRKSPHNRAKITRLNKYE